MAVEKRILIEVTEEGNVANVDVNVRGMAFFEAVGVMEVAKLQYMGAKKDEAFYENLPKGDGS